MSPEETYVNVAGVVGPLTVNPAPLAAAADVAPLATVMFKSSISSVVVFNVTVLPLTTRSPVTVKSVPTVIAPVTAKLVPTVISLLTVRSFSTTTSLLNVTNGINVIPELSLESIVLLDVITRFLRLIVDAAPNAFIVVAVVLSKLNVVWSVVISPPLTCKSRSTTRLLLTLVSPVAAPISTSVAAPAKFTVVATVLYKF